jgi:acetyl/propionyl-CoA carboxylase alpha subunit
MTILLQSQAGPSHGTVDPLFRDAEQRARAFSLLPEPRDRRVAGGAGRIAGLISNRRIRRTLKSLAALEVDEYIRRTVAPAEDPGRVGAGEVLAATSWELVEERLRGPLYAAVFETEIEGWRRRFGVLAQERSVQNGVWMPEHHDLAVDVIRSFAGRNLPIVALMDTPGADAGEMANRGNQAHAISRLIAEMAQLHAPTVGIVLGNGYSGGAIPLATTNVLLSVRDGVFNTIQPRGLANIVRRYDLSWEECAKAVGVSAYELFDQGYLDGVIDFVPGEGGDRLACFEAAVASSIAVIEQRAKIFVRDEPAVFEHYRLNTRRYVDPSRSLLALEEVASLSRLRSPTEQVNVFGVAFRYLRYLGLRRRLTSTTVSSYGRLAAAEVPAGAARARRERQRRLSFERWFENPLAVRYDDVLSRTYKRYAAARDSLHEGRGRLASFLLGSREYHFNRARAELLLEFGFHLYNQWKDAAEDNFGRLLDVMRAVEAEEVAEAQPAVRPGAALDPADLNVLDVILQPQLLRLFRRECENFICFDRLYDHIFLHLREIAAEAREENVIARESVHLLLRHSLNAALGELTAGLKAEAAAEAEARLRRQFRSWLRHFSRHPRRGRLLKSVAEWKRLQMPRISEPLFGLVTFLFERLLPNFYEDEQGIRTYDGRISPRNIGIKDFWNRLDAAYRDLLLEDVLAEQKRKTPRRPQAILDRFFTDVQEIEPDRMTADPVGFPGLRVSIERALEQGVTPCGTVAALARIRTGAGGDAEGGSAGSRVGVLVSNLAFQAGSFDMASSEKFCKLLLRCAEERLPVVCFISSGGMLTKEGAGALFSMSIVNDRITRFVRDNDLPVICFGYGDCTGGAQASLVTHPLVQTYYFSGTNMPFAGQIVVPSHLPMASTLSNYLFEVEGAMQGLVQHPFGEELDDQLRNVDSQIPVPEETVEDILQRLLEEERRVEFLSARRRRRETEIVEPAPAVAPRPVRRALIHARGCTAVKLVRVAQRSGVEVVLVQSDPDVESPAAAMLRERDSLVCIGGSTPDESYLNAHSVIRVAEREDVDALHPGIGFLSESASFADLCRGHGLNFIGPTGDAMRRMGNKSNAIKTAVQVGVPVVPGSEGILTDVDTALEVAESIGFPVMLKAVHGGGGKGIRRVDRAEDFREAFAQIRIEAESAFGNADCYLEKCVVSLRHVEVQVLCDQHGTVNVLGLRDCSVQRNNQKLIEESGSTALPEALREESFRHAAAIARKIGYVGAGTVEFIFDLEAQRLYFMEMNTRLQVEHPVTEATSGTDIVKAQFEIAGGSRVPDSPASEDGYAMEVRINAERVVVTPDGIDLLPSPGTVSRCEFPQRSDIDVLATIDTGTVVSPYYDSLVAQVVCHGKDRADTIARMRSYLDQVTIEGVCTNLPLLRRVLDDEQFRTGDYDTRYLPGFLARTRADDLVREVERSAGVSATMDRAEIEIEGSDELKVRAPSGGLFYAASSPNDPPFVRVGDILGTEKTLCLIEAMKLFRPVSLSSIDAGGDLFARDARYEVMRVNAANGQVVNQGDLLFVVRPLADS